MMGLCNDASVSECLVPCADSHGVYIKPEFQSYKKGYLKLAMVKQLRRLKKLTDKEDTSRIAPSSLINKNTKAALQATQPSAQLKI